MCRYCATPGLAWLIYREKTIGAPRFERGVQLTYALSLGYPTIAGFTRACRSFVGSWCAAAHGCGGHACARNVPRVSAISRRFAGLKIRRPRTAPHRLAPRFACIHRATRLVAVVVFGLAPWRLTAPFASLGVTRRVTDCTLKERGALESGCATGSSHDLVTVQIPRGRRPLEPRSAR